ncbi:MAG: hypothetical protein IPK16_11815 [Anaerolineales bacterium]|nr:hypothetical protein [Anaerolineales bacterium]
MPTDTAGQVPRGKPLALVVFLENVGHLAGLSLPQWVMNTIDFTTEEYAKLLLHWHGAYRRYDRVVILEDDLATGPSLAETLLTVSSTHTIDLLLLVHGHYEQLVGYRGRVMVGSETFDPLQAQYQADPNRLDLRMVYGLNCYGASLAPTWLALGATVANGSCGVNWFPEPSLSTFLSRWLHGQPYSEAVVASNVRANQWWRLILKNKTGVPGQEHPWIESSRQIVFGVRDVSINS